MVIIITVTVERIVNLMDHYGTSGAFISRLCGKSRTLVASWQSDKATPSESDLATIAERFGVSVAYLRGDVDVPDAKTSMQQALMESAQGLTDAEMLKVIEYVRFIKFLRDEQKKADP